MTPFGRTFPHQGASATRVLTTYGYPGLPDDEYGLLEAYCADPECHRRRVMINVTGRHRKALLAAISYEFDRDDELAGPFLDPPNPQSAYSEILLRLVEQVLADPAYVARLDAPYYQVKGAMADPCHPAHKLLARSAENGGAERPRPRGTKRPRRKRPR